MSQPALHQAIVVVDVAGFTNPKRKMVHQLAVQEGVYGVLRVAFAEAGVDLGSCTMEDRGDGAVILVPPGVAKIQLADQLPNRLIAGLRRYNAVHSAEAAVQLRVGLHAGEVHQNSYGAVGHAVNGIVEPDEMHPSPGVCPVVRTFQLMYVASGATTSGATAGTESAGDSVSLVGTCVLKMFSSCLTIMLWSSSLCGAPFSDSACAGSSLAKNSRCAASGQPISAMPSFRSFINGGSAIRNFLRSAGEPLGMTLITRSRPTRR